MLAFCHLLLTLTFVFLVAWTKLDSYLVSLFFAFGHSSLWFVIWCFFVLFTLLVHTGFLAVTWAAINPVLCSISMYGGKKKKQNHVVSFILESGPVPQEAHVRSKRETKPPIQVAWFTLPVICVSWVNEGKITHTVYTTLSLPLTIFSTEPRHSSWIYVIWMCKLHTFLVKQSNKRS